MGAWARRLQSAQVADGAWRCGVEVWMVEGNLCRAWLAQLFSTRNIELCLCAQPQPGYEATGW